MQSRDNRYRYYSEKDMHKILAIEMYRSVNLGIPEMKKILYESDIKDICGIISAKRKSIKDEIARLEKINNNLLHIEEACSDIRDRLWEIKYLVLRDSG